MTLSDYIRKVGVAKFAKRFGITKRAAMTYMYEERSPKPDLAVQIVSRTPVTLAGIYQRPKPVSRPSASE